MFLSGGGVTRWHQLDTITHPHNNIVISAPTFITVWLCDLLRINLQEMLMRAAGTTTPTRSNDLCAFRPCNARVGGWACELLINCDERTVRQGMIYAIPGGKLFIFCLPQHYHPPRAFYFPLYTHGRFYFIRAPMRVRGINPCCHIFSHFSKQQVAGLVGWFT